MIKYFFIVFSLLTIASASPILPGLERLPETQTGIGTVLIHELGCFNCHTQSPLNPMTKQGPILDQLGNRVREEWLRAFIANPSAIKQGTTMPDLFKQSEHDAETIEAIAQFLLSDQSPDKKLPRTNQASVGKTLYHKIGCVACHGPNPIENKTLNDAFTPLGDLKRKYSLGSLTHFIQHPLKHRPSGRMPDFKLTAEDSSHLAAYLIERKDMDYFINPDSIKKIATSSEMIKKGKQAFITKGCANCHAKKDVDLKATFIAWNDLDLKSNKGCLSEHSAVDYKLSSRQINGIKTAHLTESVNDETKILQTMASFNCFACHSRHQVGGPQDQALPFFSGEESLGDEGKFPPKLNDVGRKFKHDWLYKVLNGEGALRTSLNTKMPDFGIDNVKHLIELFKQQDLPIEEHQQEHLEHGHPEIGRQLLGSTALNCIMCHDLKDKKSIGIPAIDLAGATERYRPVWFRENLIHPNLLRPGTIMPSFWPNGISTQSHILNGDTHLQIASIWAYLNHITEYPEGYPPPRNKFELIPEDRPIVFRTFIEASGHYAIAVGDPLNIHYAYDSEKCAPTFIWKGRFLDAYNTWFNRFAPLESPLGEIIQKLAPQALICATPGKSWPVATPLELGYQYKGYRINAEHYPIFLLSYLDCEIEDSFKPSENGKSLIRNIKISGNHSDLWFNPNIPTSQPNPKSSVYPPFKKLDLSKGSLSLSMEYPCSN